MDNYPAHLAPEFDEGGAPSTPFEDWWRRVAAEFPTVPKDVAKYWLYEHWRHSPFLFLTSRNYEFEAQDWEPSRIYSIRSRWCDYEPGNAECLDHGEYLLTLKDYRTTSYMLQHGVPPARLIVLDNRDGHVVAGSEDVPTYEDMPAAYVLVEGHRRFNIALALARGGHLKSLPLWLMTKKA